MNRLMFKQIGILLALSLLFSGCDAFLDEEPTCENSITIFYEQDCAFFSNDEMAPLYDAINNCEDILEYEQEIKCEKHVYKWLKCINQASAADNTCNGCDYHLAEMTACEEAAYDSQSYDYGK